MLVSLNSPSNFGEAPNLLLAENIANEMFALCYGGLRMLMPTRHCDSIPLRCSIVQNIKGTYNTAEPDTIKYSVAALHDIQYLYT